MNKGSNFGDDKAAFVLFEVQHTYSEVVVVAEEDAVSGLEEADAL